MRCREGQDSDSSGDDSSEASEGGSQSCQQHEGPDTPAIAQQAHADRKAHKKAVKEANRERRKTKLPKHVKKKLVNKHRKH